jgi:hypothetical protein
MPSVVDLTSEASFIPTRNVHPSNNNAAAAASKAHLQDVQETTMPTSTFTEDAHLELLFDPKYIPSSLHDSVGGQYHVRLETLLYVKVRTY